MTAYDESELGPPSLSVKKPAKSPKITAQADDNNNKNDNAQERLQSTINLNFQPIHQAMEIPRFGNGGKNQKKYESGVRDGEEVEHQSDDQYGAEMMAAISSSNNNNNISIFNLSADEDGSDEDYGAEKNKKIAGPGHGRIRSDSTDSGRRENPPAASSAPPLQISNDDDSSSSNNNNNNNSSSSIISCSTKQHRYYGKEDEEVEDNNDDEDDDHHHPHQIIGHPATSALAKSSKSRRALILWSVFSFETLNDITTGLIWLVLGILILVWMLLPLKVLESLIWWGFGFGCSICGILPMVSSARRIYSTIMSSRQAPIKTRQKKSALAKILGKKHAAGSNNGESKINSVTTTMMVEMPSKKKKKNAGSKRKNSGDNSACCDCSCHHINSANQNVLFHKSNNPGHINIRIMGSPDTSLINN